MIQSDQSKYSMVTSRSLYDEHLSLFRYKVFMNEKTGNLIFSMHLRNVFLRSFFVKEMMITSHFTITIDLKKARKKKNLFA